MSDGISAAQDRRLARAVDFETSGQLDQAAAECQVMLEADPEHPGALHRLGVVMGRLGQRDLRLRLIGQAIVRAPAVAAYHRDLGEALLDAGHPTDALEAFRAALALEPDPSAAAGAADALIELGDADGARRELGPLLDPGRPARVDRTLGRLALLESRPAEAVEHLLVWLRSAPADAAALFYLGVALQGQDLLEPAVACYRQAVALDGELFEAWSNLSTALLALGRPEEALGAADRAAELAPVRPGAWLNRANARRDAGDLDGAGDAYRRAIDLDPSYAEAWSSLANLYHDRAEWGLALDSHARAAALAPDLPQVRWNQSFTLLATGQLEAGWEAYEPRLETAAARPEPRDFPWPRWNGENPAGRSLLVWREQGLGDELLFAAALPLVAARGARITLLASPRLVSLFRRAFPGVDVRADGPGAIEPGEAFDLEIPIGSLPRGLRLARTDFARIGPFLAPDLELKATWAARLAGLPPGPRIGICWRSGLLTPDRLRHYAPLEAWAPVFAVPGAVFVNLQYDDCSEELERIEGTFGIRVHRWEGENLRDDLESVVALLAGLDGVVSAPTAVTSLAGAVGTPTWQVDSGSDWTVFGEDRSPWFPSLRILRKAPDDSDWTSAMAAAADNVRALGGPGRAKGF